MNIPSSSHATNEWNFFEELPDEKILEIGSYLRPQDAFNARLVNRRFSRIFSDHRAWQCFYHRLGLQAPKYD